MALKFFENFVSYQLNVEDRGVAAAQLDNRRCSPPMRSLPSTT